ncbi:MAG: hypothetical protein ACKVVT_01820 [Dehalococcoidia bacterium]
MRRRFGGSMAVSNVGAIVRRDAVELVFEEEEPLGDVAAVESAPVALLIDLIVVAQRRKAASGRA